jgi:hypothetical protein
MYCFQLSPRVPRNEEKEMNVGKGAYFQHEVGDSIDSVLRNGRFGIPWFYEK